MTTAYDLTTIVPDLEYSVVFVPWSKSRNAAEKQPSLNWRITFKRGAQSLTEDYMQGIGHLPGHKHGVQTIAKDAAEKTAAENGVFMSHRLAAPAAADVMHSLLCDAEAIDYPTFKEWAANYDYDTDSRKSEKIYRACLEIGLRLRALIGDAKVNELREYLRDL